MKNNDFNLQKYLQEELVKRCQTNSNYSLRAFAKFLNIDSSRLSKILNGKRPINLELTEKFGEKLGLDFALIENLKSRLNGKKEKKYNATDINNNYFEISVDIFEVISDWQHYAILELMKLADFDSNPQWIANKLGISLYETKATIERLVRVNLLHITDDGQWIDQTDGFSSSVLKDNQTTYAHKKHQQQVLSMAMNRLNNLPKDKRDNSSTMMATSSKKLTEAKKMIANFRKELCEFLEDTKEDEKDSVFQLGVALYPLTTENKKEK